MRVTLAAAALCPMLAGEVSSKYCDGGHYCTPPKECCTLDCCYTPFTPTGYHPPTVSPPSADLLSIVMWNHWYYWFVVLFVALSCVGCFCSVWRHWNPQPWRCCWRSAGEQSDGECEDEDEDEEPSSEQQSTRSCCPPPPPPHYSRCPAPPPPYTEVTAKPDLYPLVIGYGDSGKPAATTASSYLMVQYFRNYIVRPVGSSLSATSTADSLSSSFLCSAANEANCMIPPPYSSSMDGMTEPLDSQSVPAPPPPPQSFMSAAALSTTGSDVSSLAGGGSPPQATSPTQEIREILDKIQQLPLSPKRRRSSGRVLVFGTGHRHWLPRSAPTTPSGNAPPGPLLPPPAPRPSSSGNRRWHGSSASGTEDGSPLLGECCSGDERDAYNDV